MNTSSWRIIALLSIFSINAWSANPPGVRIQNIQAVGSGCPQGSFHANISPDGSNFSLLLDNFISESNLYNPISRLLCELRITFQVPRGWSMAVIQADYRGFVYADANTMATHQALYSFDGSKPRNERPGYENSGRYSFRATEFRGPVEKNYFIRHTLDQRVVPWADCSSNGTQTLFLTTFLMSRNFNVSSQLMAQITLDSVDGVLQSQNYQLAWRTCTPSGVRPPPSQTPTDPGEPRTPKPPGGGRPPRFP